MRFSLAAFCCSLTIFAYRFIRFEFFSIEDDRSFSFWLISSVPDWNIDPNPECSSAPIPGSLFPIEFLMLLSTWNAPILSAWLSYWKLMSSEGPSLFSKYFKLVISLFPCSTVSFSSMILFSSRSDSCCFFVIVVSLMYLIAFSSRTLWLSFINPLASSPLFSIVIWSDFLLRNPVCSRSISSFVRSLFLELDF